MMIRMARRALACLMVSLSLFVAPLRAHNGENAGPLQAPPAEVYAPSRMPDRVVLTWAGDPSESAAVTWRTSTEVTTGVAEIARSDGGPQFAGQARRVEAQTAPFTSDLSSCHYHSVHFENLTPRTLYVYRVGDGTNWSEWFQFRTASDRPSPFLFVYFGDAQNDVKSMWSRVVREAHAEAPRAAFMLHAGDLINSAQRDEEWGEWFYAGGWLNGTIPVVATPGNHEYYTVKKPDDTRERHLSDHWRAQFTLPGNGPTGLEETVYWFDYQGARIISLNSNERQEEQVSWLSDVLEKNDNTWTIVTFHHPIFSTARDRDNPALREAWKPVFDHYRVDLVLTGHDHCYGRSSLVGVENVGTGAAVRSPESGTVYVVSVSGPKMYRLDAVPKTLLERVAEGIQLYQVITIDGSTLHYQARTATGELYDAFALKKRPGRPNELIDRVPGTPTRRLPPDQDD